MTCFLNELNCNDMKLRLLDFRIDNREIDEIEKQHLDQLSTKIKMDADFNSSSDESSDDNVSEYEREHFGSSKKKYDKRRFIIQIYGIDTKGDTYSVFLYDYQPFFYVKVPDHWSIRTKDSFIEWIRDHPDVGEYFSKSILDSKLIARKELYGFNAGKNYRFVLIKFKNVTAMNKVKNLFYTKQEPGYGKGQGDRGGKRVLKEKGLMFKGSSTYLYEANIPPLLRFFHLRDVSPSGWIEIEKGNYVLHRASYKKTTCKYECTTSYKKLLERNNVEDVVPYKICSFDIEASSSHGDFPVPVKNYKRLATQIMDIWSDEEITTEWGEDQQTQMITAIFLRAFNYNDSKEVTHMLNVYPELETVDRVYPKKRYYPSESIVRKQIHRILTNRGRIYYDDETQKKGTTELGGGSGGSGNGNGNGNSKLYQHKIQEYLKDIHRDGDGDDVGENGSGGNDGGGSGGGGGSTFDWKAAQARKLAKEVSQVITHDTFMNVLNGKYSRETKLIAITAMMDSAFPPLEGDKVTFIGSTFVRYGESEPYLNHCIALNTCSSVPGAEIETYGSESDVLKAWTRLIQRENPDIIIGYNIFGFDYSFMFKRAVELGDNCVREFLKLSRNRNEICGERDKDTGTWKIAESSTTLASGTYNLEYVKMDGRIQIDLLNFFRREYQLESYKLDYVSGYFIGDSVKKIEHDETDATNPRTIVYSKNLTGLKAHTYIHFEEIGHSTDYYKDGAKFFVDTVDSSCGIFTIRGIENPDMKRKKVRWCMAKDDVTPQDIFRMTNEGPSQRAIIAKYCIQDCNLVHHLLRKVDVITGMVEMANICSVPIDFLVMRGQGIKLFSFVAKKCREMKTLIPVLDKVDDGGYEGAIVLDPKTGLYLDEPVACVDYSSLYPSSMISENLSHDSKVWTREYDLDGNLVKETGEKDPKTGEFVYDNLDGYKYVDVVYDTYEYKRPENRPKAAAVKTHVGTKHCRFAQFPNGEMAIMPKILKDLLAARKSTRASAKWKTLSMKDGNQYTGQLVDKDDVYTIIDKHKVAHTLDKESVVSVEDTYDAFQKNVLDKRQLAIKMTANSLYGQCGAKTSSFYEKDVAASTTATGRKLLTYGKRIIEEVYGDRICETSYGRVHSHAEYIYGDTDSVFMSFKLTDPETGKKIVGKEALKHTIELAKEAGELATKYLKAPHDLEYEKTFMPFCLLSKKRYVGMLYEEDPDVCYRKSMGIVLKRRDNAPIVKDVYGGIIDILMKEQDVNKAIEFTRTCLDDIVKEKYPMEKLIITKSLRAFYKNPQQIAHKVLADRMGKRDPGNKPGPGDRVPFVYIQTKGKVKLQGDKVEHPAYIRENKLKPDYSHYITNQIMKPVQQVFSLVLEDMPEFKRKKSQFLIKMRGLHRKYKDDPKKAFEMERKARDKEVKAILFDPVLNKYNLQQSGQQSIRNFFV